MNKPLYYINDASKAIALTIDDGPDPVYTPQVLRVLRKYDVTATFSMIGEHVAAYPQLARTVAEAGHKICNHTWTHSDLVGMRVPGVRDELTRASDAIQTATGVHPVLFRAPYGAWSRTVIRQCKRMDMVPLDWSVDPRDWAMPGVRSIVRNIMKNTQPGSIILEHDGGGNRSETVKALRIVLPRLLGCWARATTSRRRNHNAVITTRTRNPRRGWPAPGVYRLGYFTKYQFSGLIDNVDDCGKAPLRLFATSVSWKAGAGCHTCASCFDR